MDNYWRYRPKKRRFRKHRNDLEIFFSNILIVVAFSIFILMIGTKLVGKFEPNWPSLDSRPLPEWYDRAKIGIFIHWGVYSVPAYGSDGSFGAEWFWYHWETKEKPGASEFMKKNYPPDFTYADFARQFTAELFDPKEWADIFYKSGARYVVLTSKHHDGYTLWPSNYSFNWNSRDVGPNRDLVGDLAEEVRKMGMHFGLYYSLYEWYNPLYLRDKANQFKTDDFIRYKMRPEMEELVNAYKPEVLWSDGDWEAPDTYWNSTDFLAWLYNESPVNDRVVVNDRWGSGTRGKHGDFYNFGDGTDLGHLETHKWENAMNLDRFSYGYRREADLNSYQTIEELLEHLASTISCNGNLLINVGPTKYGTLTPIFQERLLQLGEWLQINGEAIYDSRPWLHQKDSFAENVWYTSRPDLRTIYAIVLKYPSNGIMILADLPSYDHINSIELMGTKKPVKWSPEGIIEFPSLDDNNDDQMVKWAYTLKIKLNVENNNDNLITTH